LIDIAEDFKNKDDLPPEEIEGLFNLWQVSEPFDNQF